LQHTPETTEYGISSFVYRRPRPFHPTRLQGQLKKTLPKVVRSKGSCWLAPFMVTNVEWNGTGDFVQFTNGGQFLVTLTDGDMPDDDHIRSMIKKEIAEGGIYGDRKQEVRTNGTSLWLRKGTKLYWQIVIIGVEMNRAEVERLLDQCLLTDEEMKLGPEEWENFENPYEYVEEDSDDDEEEEEEEEGESDDECEEEGHDHHHHHHGHGHHNHQKASSATATASRKR